MMKTNLNPTRIILCLLLFASLLSRAQSGADSARIRKDLADKLSVEVAAANRYATALNDSLPGAAVRVIPPASPKRKILDSAIHHSELAIALADSIPDRRMLGELYSARSRLEAAGGHFDKAHDYYINGWNINDSFHSQQKKNELSELQGKHDRETRNKELAVHKLQVANQRKALAGLIAGLALLAVFGALLYRQNRLRKRTNTTLLLLNNQLEEANKIKARFFGILSHDLRSPIANLLGFLHLVKNDPDSFEVGEKAEHQQHISRSAAELLETMEAMLLWSKEQMDSFKPELREINIDDLFSYLQKFFGQERTVALHFVNPEALSITGDENYLRVIMQNLTSNALKALKNNPAGTVEWKAVRDGNTALLSITDNGPGLNKEQVRALFSETSSVNARSGFGFHLIRDLAAAIHYQITVDSEPGKGARFNLQYARSAVPKPSSLKV